jgi:sugar O-acyltransferase (sialic acid O-acetyltransferase NeuD family)
MLPWQSLREVKSKHYDPEASMRIVIIGAGQHSQVMADILLRMQENGESLDLAGYLDDDPLLTGLDILGFPVLGGTDDLIAVEHDAIIAAIGDNHTRSRMFDRFLESGERFFVAKHPRAIIAPDVRLGEGSMVCAGVVVNTGTIIGRNVILNTGCTVDHHSQIGCHVHIAPGVHIAGEVTVGEGALIGIGATVMPGRRIGAWSVVGAGALVHEDIPDRVVALGVPAKVRRSL